MEQHQPRLGDVLDDYCPRERRVTNHAVVALVADEIKLTRCTTCDTEHPYKAARVPPRRKTKVVTALSGTSKIRAEPALQGSDNSALASASNVSTGLAPHGSDDPVSTVSEGPAAPAVESVPSPPADSVRRPLIRATLERPEGTPPPVRQAPVFTIRETTSREDGQRRKRRSGAKFRGQSNGNRADTHDGQTNWSGSGKNGSRSTSQRSANRSPSNKRSDRSGKGKLRNRGRGHSR